MGLDHIPLLAFSIVLVLEIFLTRSTFGNNVVVLLGHLSHFRDVDHKRTSWAFNEGMGCSAAALNQYFLRSESMLPYLDSVL